MPFVFVLIWLHKMSFYLFLNILIIIIPLSLTFESKIRFYKKLPFLFFAILAAGIPYIIWDSIFESKGIWSFNSEFVLPIKLFGLPLEEILFFITVPYSILFIYETVKLYIEPKIYKIHAAFFIIAAAVFTLFGIIVLDKTYTSTVLFSASVSIAVISIFDRELLRNRIFLITILLSYLGFFLINYLLTSFPVVIYNENEILNIRITTIPAEDFIYSFSMISLQIFFYEAGLKWREIKG